MSGPSENQILQFKSSKWTNQTVSLPQNLYQLSDTTISSPLVNQFLFYNGQKLLNEYNNSTLYSRYVFVQYESDVNKFYLFVGYYGYIVDLSFTSSVYKKIVLPDMDYLYEGYEFHVECC